MDGLHTFLFTTEVYAYLSPFPTFIYLPLHLHTGVVARQRAQTVVLESWIEANPAGRRAYPFAISLELEGSVTSVEVLQLVTIPSWRGVGAATGRPLVEALVAVIVTEVLVVVALDDEAVVLAPHSSSQISTRRDYSTWQRTGIHV